MDSGPDPGACRTVRRVRIILCLFALPLVLLPFLVSRGQVSRVHQVAGKWISCALGVSVLPWLIIIGREGPVTGSRALGAVTVVCLYGLAILVQWCLPYCLTVAGRNGPAALGTWVFIIGDVIICGLYSLLMVFAVIPWIALLN